LYEKLTYLYLEQGWSHTRQVASKAQESYRHSLDTKGKWGAWLLKRECDNT